MTPDLVNAELGEEARAFVESPLGQALIQMAREEIMAVHVELEKVSPSDFDKIQSLQNEIKVARYFESWLAQLISKGDEALEAYKQQKQGL